MHLLIQRKVHTEIKNSILKKFHINIKIDENSYTVSVPAEQ